MLFDWLGVGQMLTANATHAGRAMLPAVALCPYVAAKAAEGGGTV
jgi:hypothetical protein